LWSTSRAQQALANQCGSRQGQRPLSRAPLATANKDADHIEQVSQLKLLVLRDSTRRAHSSRGLPNSNSANRLLKRSPRKTGSPPPAGSQSPGYRTRTTAFAHAWQANAAGASPEFVLNLRGCLSKYSNRHPTYNSRSLPLDQLA
jgi:hypothetical protein